MHRSLIKIEPERGGPAFSQEIFLFSNYKPRKGTRIKPGRRDWFLIREVFSSQETKTPVFGDVVHLPWDEPKEPR